MASTPRLFISYSHDDARIIDRLRIVPIVESLGFDPWLDRRRGLTAGSHIDDVIGAAIAASAGLLALWSPAYVREGAYTETEYCRARFSAGIPVAIVVLEPVRPTHLGSAMARLLVPQHVLTHSDPADLPAILAEALNGAGLRLPYGAPPQRSANVDLAAGTISPTYAQLCSQDGAATRRSLERLHSILAGNPGSAYHAINAALLSLHLGDTAEAADLAQRALANLAHNGEIAYFAALVATAMKPLAEGNRERIVAIWGLAERAASSEPTRSLARILQVAIVTDYHVRNGMQPPADAGTLLRQVKLGAADRSELMRLGAVLHRAAPHFHARYFDDTFGSALRRV